MTIAVLVKVNDGFVLASDSATTLGTAAPGGALQVENIYNNANKIFNLRKGLPIGAMTWGLGAIGPASIATVTKDLRRRFMGEDANHPDWYVDPKSYQMSEVAARFKEFFYDERYQAAASAALVAPDDLGLLVAGYGADDDQPQVYSVTIGPSGCSGPDLLMPPDVSGASWWGQPEALTRLLLGVSRSLPQALLNLGVPDTDVGSYVQAIQQEVREQLVSSAMPIQDAIDLAEFLVEVTIKFVRFSPGHPTVGGPIEIAAVTKHEGFKWVARKHYFQSRMNPVEG